MAWQYPTMHRHSSRIIDSDPALFDKSLLDADVSPRACPGLRELNTNSTLACKNRFCLDNA